MAFPARFVALAGRANGSRGLEDSIQVGQQLGFESDASLGVWVARVSCKQRTSSTEKIRMTCRNRAVLAQQQR